jgi:glycosyltransferase involved in cell wall biosynthesis
MKNVLIVGNGSIGITGNSKFYINNHTGYFLRNLNKQYSVTFTQGSSTYDKNNNLQNFELKKNKIEYRVLPKTKEKGFFSAVYKLLKTNDFIYLFYPGTVSKVFGLFAILINKPFGLYIRGQNYKQNFLDRLILKNTKFILTVSPLFADDLNKYCSKIAVIKPMIDIERDDLKRDRIFFNRNKKNLLFVGRVEVRKGIYELLEIAQELKKNQLDFNLHIVGGGDLFHSLKSKILTMGISSNIVMHGLVSDKSKLKKLYDTADVFVFTSYDEGFPRVLYEAMASALPIFTTFVGGISGRMNHLGNCIEIPVKDGITSAQIISKYIIDYSTLEFIGRNGQKTIEHIIDGSLLNHEELLIKELYNEE